MNPELNNPPPKLWKAFSLFYWGLIFAVCGFVVLLLALLVLLMVALVVGWIASLIS